MIQTRSDGLGQEGSGGGDDERWLNSGCILEVGPTAFAAGFGQMQQTQEIFSQRGTLSPSL